MPENFNRQLGDRSEKPKNESKFFTIKEEEEEEREGLIIKLKPKDQLTRQLDRRTAADFKQQLTDQIKSRQPSRITIDLAGKDVGDEILGAICFDGRKIFISKKNLFYAEYRRAPKIG